MEPVLLAIAIGATAIAVVVLVSAVRRWNERIRSDARVETLRTLVAEATDVASRPSSVVDRPSSHLQEQTTEEEAPAPRVTAPVFAPSQPFTVIVPDASAGSYQVSFDSRRSQS